MENNLKLVKKNHSNHNSTIHVGELEIGGNEIVIIAGPCAVESREQLFGIAKEVKEAGAAVIRGGAFKPRTSPYAFQGLGEEGLKLLAEMRDVFNISVVTEVMDPRDIDLVYRYADIIQVGTRNMQNFSLLKELGMIDKPILLKRGMMATIFDVLSAAEYILFGGNPDVIICERGIRTFETYTRNTLDIGAVVALKHLTHLPIIVDPSHASGKSKMVPPLVKAGIVAGADGAILEVHCEPDKALCDGEQSLSVNEFKKLMMDLDPLVAVIGRSLYRGSLES